MSNKIGLINMVSYRHLLLEFIEVVVPHLEYPLTQAGTVRDVSILQLLPQHQKNCPQSRTLNNVDTL
jgi:hypothetical protein